jgi:hypothetical protein
MSRRNGKPYPDDERHWITLTADAVCALASFGDRDFARQSAEHQAQRAANEAAALKKKPTRSPT